MSPTTLRLAVLSPCLSGGAIALKRQPTDPDPIGELRVPAIRGQLRWWFRAFGGSADQETELFGTVAGQGRASALQVRLVEAKYAIKVQNLEDYTGKSGNPALADEEAYFLWPLRPEKERDGQVKSIQRRAILYPLERQRAAEFTIQLRLLRPVSAFTEALCRKTLSLWPLLGALGGRSRKGYGSLWPLAEAPGTAEALQECLQLLPSDILVRLWQDGFETPRQALAFAARQLRQMRCGTNRFLKQTGIGASRFGGNDHDAADPAAGNRPSIVYRPALGLPLTQRFSASPSRPRGATVETTHEHYSRWASPVHVKLAVLNGNYAVLLVIHERMAMPHGTKLKLNSWPVMVDHGLLNQIKRAGTLLH